jgi:hypothetical protein
LEVVMTFGYVLDVPAPIEAYDALHAEILRRSDGRNDGLLLHVGRATPGGFQVLEVWESRELFDRFNAEVIGPATAELTGGQPPAQEPAMDAFEPRGLIVPAASVLV